MHDHYFDYPRERDVVTELQGLTDIVCRSVSEGFEAETGAWTVRALPVDHSIETYTYRFEKREIGTSFVFTADTRPIPELEAFASGADVLINEVILGSEPIYLDEEGVAWETYVDPLDRIRSRMDDIHSTAAQTGEIVAAADVDELVLTSLMLYRDLASIRPNAERAFGEQVTAASDGAEL